MNPLENLLTTRPPTAARPLLGQTVLVVEDSRYACEAMRLMCIKSGARIRRASTLAQARKHLQTYRPSVVVIDLGLPDGSGLDLIDELNQTVPRVQVVLGTSGDTNGAQTAREAGADGFLAKPVPSLGEFQHAVLAHLPSDRVPQTLRSVSEDEIAPDPLALHDDLVHIADLLGAPDAQESAGYITQFIDSVARSSDDLALARASKDLAEMRKSGGPLRPAMARLASTIQDRINHLPPAV